MRDAGCWVMPDAGCRMLIINVSGIRHPALSIRHPASGIRHHASGIRHPASRITHHASRITHHASIFPKSRG
jgi:hypothetical protein